MKITDEIDYQVVNGRQRKVCKAVCTGCGLTKWVRADSKQTTELCKKCNSITHGMTDTRLYTIFMNMKSRCYNENNNRYKYYGAKGIEVCSEWLHSFETFNTWALSNGYTDELTIDRKDGSLNYSPDNCRWATTSQQAVNRVMPAGKSGLHGVTTRHVTQIRLDGKVVFSKECDTALEAAYHRELYILQNNLEHVRNFPEATIEDIQSLLDTMPLT